MHSRTSRPARLLTALSLSAALATALAACGHENGDETARDSESAGSATSTGDAEISDAPGSDAPGDDATGDYPTFAPEDYAFRLEVLCYCPQVGAVRVRVRDGKVVSARMLQDARSAPKGAEAPAYAKKTINDIIALANDSKAASVDVTWPDGQDYPSAVAVDRIADATDDEVTYTIRNVNVQ